MNDNTDWHSILLEVALRRNLRLVGSEEKYRLIFAIESFSDKQEYEIRYDLRDGSLTCTCNDFTCRKARKFPTIADTRPYLCKHLALWREWFETVMRGAQ